MSALATAPLELFRGEPEGESPEAANGPLTLEERLERELGAALSGRPAACPACGGAMGRMAQATARCGDCGSVLS